MEFQIVSSDELYNLLKGPDEFLQKKTISNFKYLSFEFNHIKQDSFVVALGENKQVMGILEYGPSGVEKNLYWLRFISVHEDHRKKGVAKGLLVTCFNSISKIEDARLELSTYEPEGAVLIDFVCDLAKNYDFEIKHKSWDTDYQNAKDIFVKKGDKVYVEDSEYTGEGIVKYFFNSMGPMMELSLGNGDTVKVKTNSVLHKIK